VDLAQIIFEAGVGVGAVLAGIGVVLIALSVRRLARDARSLADDARRLVRLTEELPAVLGDGRVATEDQAFAIEAPQPATPEPLAPPRAAVGPVQSAKARKDEQIA
jgi:hypothetical protein